MLGGRIDKYAIVEKLGEGGMGAVYVGVHDVLRKKAAIKVILPQWTSNAMVVQRFVNEAIAMGALEHPNIVGVTDAGQLHDGSWFIVMEYLEGGTLGRFCASQGGPLSIHLTLQILGQVAAGLEAAHKRGIVHRDLKPENIFLVVRGRNPHFVKILDWGISKLGEELGGTVTKTGMMAGTPAYMAPEQMTDSRTVDRRSDVYALGVIAYQMVTGGWLPFQRQDRPEEFAQLSAPAIHLRQMQEDPVDPRRRFADVPEGWASAILAALNKDPARRPQSARAFLLLLAGATAGDSYNSNGADILKEFASELLEIGNLEETVRAVKPSVARPTSRYKLGDQLGAGGMAEVFRATQLGAEGVTRTVAVKRVLPGFSAVPQFASMFVQEARIASMLSHPNIVSISDFDRDEEGRLFLAMEFVEGRDLAALMATGRIPFSTTIFILSETLRGLGYAHDLPMATGPRGVVHRDVSPQNVLLSWEGAVKVSDFGIAKAREATAATASTMVKGKPQYMSPEQANGQALDGRSDLFAVGIMLWELLTGRRLFAGGTTHEVFAQIALGRVPLPSTIERDVPRDLEAIAMRLLAPDPSIRHANAGLVIEDLSRCNDTPRDGRGELIRVMAERFPDAIAARGSLQNIAGGVATAPGKKTPLEATRKDASPQPTPVGNWPPNSTLQSAAGQTAPSAKMRPSLLAAIGIGVAALAAVGAFLISRERHQPATNNATATGSNVQVETQTDPLLTVTTDPPGAFVHVDGVVIGEAPVKVPLRAGRVVSVEARHQEFEPTSQSVTMGATPQTISIAMRPRVAPAPAPDAGQSTSTATTEATTSKKPPKPPIKGATKQPSEPPKVDAGVGGKQGSGKRFNPDDAAD